MVSISLGDESWNRNHEQWKDRITATGNFARRCMMGYENSEYPALRTNLSNLVQIGLMVKEAKSVGR